MKKFIILLCFSCLAVVPSRGAENNKEVVPFRLLVLSLESIHEYILTLPDLEVKYQRILTHPGVGRSRAPEPKYELTKKGKAYKLVEYQNVKDQQPSSVTSFDGKSFYFYSYRDRGLRVSSKLDEVIGFRLINGIRLFPPLALSSFYKSYPNHVEMVSPNKFVRDSKKSSNVAHLTISDDVYDMAGVIIPKFVKKEMIVRSSGNVHPWSSVINVTECHPLDGKYEIKPDFFKIPLSQCVRVIDHDLDHLLIELDNE